MSEKGFPKFAELRDGPRDQPNGKLRVLVTGRGTLVDQYHAEVVQLISGRPKRLPAVGTKLLVFGSQLTFEEPACSPTI